MVTEYFGGKLGVLSRKILLENIKLGTYIHFAAIDKLQIIELEVLNLLASDLLK